MNNTTCPIRNCTQPTYPQHDMCQQHYTNLITLGDPLPARPRNVKADLTGKTYGQLTVIKHVPKQGWQCLCACGKTRTLSATQLNSGVATTCADKRTHKRSTNPGYNAIHRWLTRDRGKASAHPCVQCGAPAHQWSYDHNDTDNELTSELGYVYTTNLTHYEPKCGRCHRQSDMAERIARGLPVTGRRIYKSRVGA